MLRAPGSRSLQWIYLGEWSSLLSHHSYTLEKYLSKTSAGRVIIFPWFSQTVLDSNILPLHVPVFSLGNIFMVL